MHPREGMEEIGYSFLKHISKEMRPVLANEVFAAFSSRKDLMKGYL